ncbi:hypothetical protein QBZ16_000593 [Prototheca wickerhamii]|uniref:Uncharacterized protein n=1 Tax=Prototheca wickerhamii TaxID=3111 RepID=A0AAD9INM0_PROWI|nr:hypothetical protein QBZ16_000593 [Prototheca wickerhamii]
MFLIHRFLPYLEPKHIKYELHLFAENVNAPASRVGELILGKAQQLCPALPDDGDRYEGDVGSVASFLLENCKLPLALVQPADYSFDDDNAASVATSED